MKTRKFLSKNIRPFLSTFLIIALIVSVNFLLVHFESADKNSGIKTFFDAVWYMFVSLTTVGYGDMFPVTQSGKIIGYIYILSSLGLLGYLIGKFSNKFNEIMEKKKLGFYGTDAENHVVIIGWNDFTSLVIGQIVQANKFVTVVTNNKNDIDLITDLYGEKVFVLFADFENFEALEKINIRKSVSVFVGFPSDTDTLVYVLNLRKNYSDLKIIVLVNNSNLKETFISAGVLNTVSKDGVAAKLVASHIFEPDVAEITEELIATSTQNEYDIVEYKVTESNPFLNSDCGDVFFKLKEKYNCILIGISKNQNGEKKLVKNPPKEVKVEKGDYLILMGLGDAKKKLDVDFGVKEGRVD